MTASPSPQPPANPPSAAELRARLETVARLDVFQSETLLSGVGWRRSWATSYDPTNVSHGAHPLALRTAAEAAIEALDYQERRADALNLELVAYQSSQRALIAERDRLKSALAEAEKDAAPSVPEAMAVIRAAMQADLHYAWTWFCNIAVMAQDAGAPHVEANERAADFMKLAFEVDIRQANEWCTLFPPPPPAGDGGGNG